MADSDSKHASNPERSSVDANEKAEPVKSSEPVRNIRGISWALIVISIFTTTFLFGLDNTIVAVIQPAIVTEFDSIDRLPWIATTFLMGAGSTCLFWGQMYGQCNTKWLYITCIILFEVGSALCGAAPNMAALIVGRAICGIGGTGMYTGVLTLLSMLATPREKATYFGLSGLVWGAGTVLGPIIGGAFTSSSAGWRWSFYINLCVAAICAPVYLFLVPSLQPRPGASIMERIRCLDFVGTILLSGSYTSLLMAISFGGVIYAWDGSRIIALFVVAGVLTIAFIGHQFFPYGGTTKATRSFPVHFLGRQTLAINFILESCGASIMFIALYFIPLYFQFVRSNSALTAGVKTLPLVVFLVAAIVINGFAVSATGRYMPWFLCGGILSLVGSATLYSINPRTSDAMIYGFSILIGTGAGCFVQLPFSVVQSLVEPQEIPSAIGFVTFAQLGAPAVVLAMVNAIFLNETSIGIAASLPQIPRDTVSSILSGVGSMAFSKLSQDAQQTILGHIVDGLNQGYIMAMIASVITVLLSVLLPRGKMFA